MSSPEREPAADLYVRLGVEPDASTAQIHAAYRRLALALHPDSAEAGGADPAALQRVIDAHHVLADPLRRQRYDASRRSMPTTISRAQPVIDRACPVCKGTGTLRRPCDHCAGSGYVLSRAPWLQASFPCAACSGTGQLLGHCGACGSTGRTSP